MKLGNTETTLSKKIAIVTVSTIKSMIEIMYLFLTLRECKVILEMKDQDTFFCVVVGPLLVSGLCVPVDLTIG